MTVKQNDWIEVDYTGKLKNGDVFDTSKGREPLRFKVGAGMVIPGFDASVIGMDLNNNKSFTIPFIEAYGPKNTEAVEIPKTSFKDIDTLEKGKSYNFITDMGPIKIDVEDILDDMIKATINHPLAGEDLTFDIKLVKILSEDEAKAYEAEVMAHEHAHHHEHHDHSKCGCEDGECGDDCECDDCDSDDEDDSEEGHSHSCGCGHKH